MGEVSATLSLVGREEQRPIPLPVASLDSADRMSEPHLPVPTPVVGIHRVEQIAIEAAAAGLPMSRPVLILIGGASAMDADAADILAPIIRDGVLAAAIKVGAIVVDGGTDAGVMAMAGKARIDLGSDLHLVGVAPAGRTSAPGVEAARGSTPVEPNHSLVMLVPGDDWGSESPWLVSAARILSGGRPVAAVVVDGGQISLSEAAECAAQGWPVLTVAGSGRTADQLARFAAGETDPEVNLPRTSVRVVELSAGAPALASTLHELLDGGSDLGGRPPPRSADYPALYVAASEAAKRGQTIHRRLSLAEISLTTVGLSIVLVTAFIQPLIGLESRLVTSVTVAASALSFLVALLLKFIGRSSGFDADWYNGRALAETVKSLAWRYMMRVQPYAAADADRRFAVDLAGLLRRTPGFRQATDRLPQRPHQISGLMRDTRGLTVVERRDHYVPHRLLDQADWYQLKSAASNRKGTRWFWVTVLFQLAAAAIAIGALAGADDSLLRIIALLGSIALAIAAWSQLNRYDELARSYAVAFQELTLIAAVADGVIDEAGLSDLVGQGEQAIGREHRLWVAKRTEAIEGPSDIDEGDIGSEPSLR